MFYESILSKHQLTIEQLSKPTQGLVTKYNNTVKYLAEIETKLAAATAEKTKTKLTTEIQEVKDYLLQLEAQITKKIEQFAKNKDVYAANAERLRQGRLAKKGGATPVATEPAPVVATPPADPIEPQLAPVQEEPKSKSGLGWLIGGVVGIGLAIFGINYYNNR